MLDDHPIASRHQLLEKVWVLAELEPEAIFHDLFFDWFPVGPEGNSAFVASLEGIVRSGGLNNVLFLERTNEFFGLEVVLVGMVEIAALSERREVDVAELSILFFWFVEVDRGIVLLH